mmetsp:Transcript_15119/g.46701  ORF Transcript_15119/g.46701 Transcript_15119/m.46701 type:complete len:228 (-) Transcript_15119:3240-3923(-)
MARRDRDEDRVAGRGVDVGQRAVPGGDEPRHEDGLGGLESPANRRPPARAARQRARGARARVLAPLGGLLGDPAAVPKLDAVEPKRRVVLAGGRHHLVLQTRRLALGGSRVRRRLHLDREVGGEHLHLHVLEAHRRDALRRAHHRREVRLARVRRRVRAGAPDPERRGRVFAGLPAVLRRHLAVVEEGQVHAGPRRELVDHARGSAARRRVDVDGRRGVARDRDGFR